MLKYNYQAAAELWDRYNDLCVCDMSLCGLEMQRTRRQFMHDVTRRENLKIYIDYVYYTIDELKPIDSAKSRVFDFEYERALEQLIYDIKILYTKNF